MILFHGGFMPVKSPKIRASGHYKDFGFGFYCTNLQRQAEKWAREKRRGHVVSVYSYDESTSINRKVFPELSEEWLAFIVNCRRGVPHSYDIVEGPMADDTIWDYVEDYVAGNISKAAFWELVKFRYPTHQIVFCTDESLLSLQFQRSYEV